MRLNVLQKPRQRRQRIEDEGNAGMEKLDIFPERDNADGVG